ncbi:zinc finger and BTB domain-containing protein 17 [Bombina bombina]|uniref:zinc finger and BTB domain-containing protein 17 n=1 Tax=Bombina bombina TaxID=8345 RepID=UPI00235B1BCD|nr:zinc finger and BTB domain-containing protein 17 [Bombina bombina]
MDPMSPEGHSWSILQKLNEQKSMGLFCDVSLMVEGKIFLAHKNVLSACSEYFYAALSRNEQQQFLVLDNVCLEGFSHLLDFIYSYKIPTCHVQDFMQAAQMLQVNLPLTVQVVSVSSSPPRNSPKEEICIPDEDYNVDDSVSEIREVEAQQLRRSKDDNIQSAGNSIYNEERRRFEPVAHLSDKPKMHKRPSFYKESFVFRNPNFFVSKPVATAGRIVRGTSGDEPRGGSFLGPGFSRQMPITIHNDVSSEEADDEGTEVCINLCDEPDTPDSLEPLAINELRMQNESVNPTIYSTIVGLQNRGEVVRVGGDENHADVHKCDRCELLLTYSEYLNHQDDPGVNIFQCNFCEKQFNYSCQLSLHLSSHHDKKFYPCDKCGKELSTLKKLHDHLAYHSDARPHKCPLCDKAYKVKNDLTQHVRLKHVEATTGKQPLLQLCEFCGQAVKHYKSHRIFCSGVKKFKCDFCVQSFHRISELKRHTWTHTGELPYRCKICGKGCRHPSNMKKHIRTVHKADMRVQINREHASPRFCKNRRPPASHEDQMLQQALPANLSMMQTVAGTASDEGVQKVSSVSPVSLSYISISAIGGHSANDFTSYDSQNVSPGTVRPI